MFGQFFCGCGWKAHLTTYIRLCGLTASSARKLLQETGGQEKPENRNHWSSSVLCKTVQADEELLDACAWQSTVRLERKEPPFRQWTE